MDDHERMLAALEAMIGLLGAYGPIENLTLDQARRLLINAQTLARTLIQESEAV